MKPEHYDRLNILKEIEGTFPGLPTGQVLDLARWVEGSEVPPLTLGAPPFFKSSRQLHKDPEHKPRKWTNLDAIPSTVKAITDRVGDRAEPQTVKGKRKWFFTDEPFDGVEVSFQDGPFTEVLGV